MSNESPGDHDAGSDSTSFETWLAQKAESADIPREELFEQLISSYWTLNEISQLLNETTENNSLGGLELSGAANTADSEFDTTGETETVTDQLDTLRERITEIQEELESVVDRRSEIESEISELTGRLTELEAQLGDTGGDSTRVSEIQDELESIESQLSAEQAEIKAQLQSRFGDVQTILQYLIEETDSLDAQVAELQQQQGAIEQVENERDKLQRLKREASDVGSYTGECGSCAGEIDIALLVRPYCPMCEAELMGVEQRSKWFVLSEAVIKTRSSVIDNEPLAQVDDSEITAGEQGQRESADRASEGTVDETKTPEGERSDGERTSTVSDIDLTGDADSGDPDDDDEQTSTDADVTLDLETDKEGTRTDTSDSADGPFGDIGALTAEGQSEDSDESDESTESKADDN
ncbi:hypothetical protein G3I44_15100 [Halogeometricum borinquense]|uniref:Uncharacterized protein n=1 Tax=Halogeometricum borinquense TaxID=60847 RepID=A0A6C0UJ12_9EURY|nr:hypothetical protein [Halogeometricum borinquense]QIB75506.1 hypothetical protein G3I44_15100 [Halogeometricum borinquense]